MHSDIEIKINSFISSGTDKKYSEIHRFNSWDICFTTFKEYFTTLENLEDKDIDYLALHLGMYLSSWGMMRGSADLLQYSYKIHKPIINKLFSFYKINQFIYKEFDENYLQCLENKTQNIYHIAKELFEEYKRIENWEQKSYHTLITKILLGVFGITPAYDRFFKAGVAKKNIIQRFSVNSLNQLILFYRDNITSFNRYENFKYPPMKLIDIYFWQFGFELNEEKTKITQK